MAEVIHLFEPRKFNKFTALHDEIIICDMEFRETITRQGIWIPNDNGTGAGIKARWGRVWAVGPEQKYVKPGQWIMLEHARWSRGIEVLENGKIITIRRADKNAILLIADEKINNVVGVSDKVDMRQKFM